MEWNEITQRLKEIETKKKEIEEFEDVLKTLRQSVYSGSTGILSHERPQQPSVMAYLFRFFNIPYYQINNSLIFNDMLNYSKLNYKTRMMIDIEEVILKHKNELQFELEKMLNIEKTKN